MTWNMARNAACVLASVCVVTPASAYSAFDGDSPWMLGDWRGARTSLSDQGIDFTLGYVSESAWNAAGGYNHDRTARYSDQWTLGAAFDLERLFDIPNAEFQMTLTDRNGRDITRDRLVNPDSGALSSTQEVWGRGQTTRLTQLWYRQTYFDDALDIKLGRIPVGADFAAVDSQFQNLALGGGQPGNWAGGIWYNWPVSQWAARVRLNMTPQWYAQIGFFNENPSNLDVRNALDLKHSGTTGTLIPAEIGWTPRLFAQELPGKYALGGYYSTADADRADGDGTTGRRFGVYFVAQQQLTARNNDPHRGLTATVQGAYNDQRTSTIDRYLSAALSYVGPFDARPRDEVGVGIGWVHVNDDVSDARRQSNIEQGYTYDDAAYLPAQGSEYNTEVYYGVSVNRWLKLQPNLQYIVHPGGLGEVDDAVVGGLRVQATL
ncbi:carbohydrate porin [Larsenimonas salina]|uniref:carbohydrate porin n=1 Tax=Larsenimonas salina TaxID=1295565 RepID=UPI002074648E|nr:carbohydrate porin [Larsenimonas salina]MCM5703801.1 carbohydrate porin [Larsenimonas salina]